MRKVAICGAARTPIGSFFGALSSVPTPKLGAAAIRAALERAGVSGEDVDECIMGCVLPANVGQAPARQAALFADLPPSVECLTINKVCGSGLKAVMLAAQAIQCGDADVIVAGGMENMSASPYYLDKARTGYRMGHGTLVDSMVKDGLWDVYNDYHMGNAAELCAREKNITREQQDAFATESYSRALAAIESGAFKDEIVAVEVPQRRGDPVVVDTDEEPGNGRLDKFGKLRPAFDREGTVTAANASSINDGAAALVVVAEEVAKAKGWPILATLGHQKAHAQDPEWFTTAPAHSIEKVLAKAKLTLDDINLFEINEAFSVVSLAVADILGIDNSRVNVNGGAVGLGHPIGASGARILVTLLYAMKARSAQRGLASLCIGGGEAVALIVETPKEA